MDTVIERVATGMGNAIGFMATNGIAFVIFAGLWLAFGAGLIWSQGSVTEAWEWIRSLPLLVQLLMWLIFLPVVAGLWVWETNWPLVLRLTLVVGLAGWSLLMFFPRGLVGGQQ